MYKRQNREHNNQFITNWHELVKIAFKAKLVDNDPSEKVLNDHTMIL